MNVARCSRVFLSLFGGALLVIALLLFLLPFGVQAKPESLSNVIANGAGILVADGSGTFTVSSLADTTTASPNLTLREALLVARGGTGAAGLNRVLTAGEQAALGGCTFSGGLIVDGCGAGFTDTIMFASSLGVNPVISLTAPLPDLADTVGTVIDGMAHGVYPVISAAGLANGTDALHITSNHNTVQGLTLTGAPQDDLRLTGSGNLITSTSLLRAGRYGVYVPGGSLNTIALAQVGASGAGNGQGGIVLDNAMTNTITATVVAGNTGNGIAIINGATKNGIISSTLIGNSQNGLLISGAATGLNGVDCSYFGITAEGVPAGNGGYGARLSAGTYDNMFKGSSMYTNVSANALGGVRLDTGAQGNWVAGYISLNGGPGVVIDSAPDNLLSIGASAGLGGECGLWTQVVGNLGPGVLVTNSTGTRIGGYTSAIGNNTGAGVELVNSSHSVVNPMVISGNGGAGIAVEGAASTNNVLQPGFADENNGGLPVDLGNDGPTPNGAHTPPGPNDWLPYPVITAYSGSVVTGTACLSCTVFIYQAVGNPAAPGGGGMFLGQTVSADGAGRWHATLSGGLTPATLTLQACQGACPLSSGSLLFFADTSEFSPVWHNIWLPYIVR